MSKPSLCLIDGAGFYYRAFYAIRHMNNSRGLPTNAVYGFATMLRKIINERAPDYAVILFDSKEKTFRHNMYELYKAHRPDMPGDLARQLPYIDRLVDGYNIASIKIPGYEADDLIGTISVKSADAGYDVEIMTSDKDLMQLVRPGVKIFDPMKDKAIGPEQVREKFGVDPENVPDILGLMGDSSDNIPGVPGIGEKTAITLAHQYGGLEEILSSAENITRKKLRENLIKYADQARLSKRLATIALDAPAPYEPEKWKVEAPDWVKLRELFNELEFSSLLETAPSTPVADVPRDYVTVLDMETFNAMITAMRQPGGFAFDTETTSKNPMSAQLVGMSFANSAGKAFYLPVRHDYPGVPKQLDIKAVMPMVKELLEDEAIPKHGQNIKYDMIVMATEGVQIKPVGFDTMLAAYLLNPGRRRGLSALAMEHLGEKMMEYSDLCGAGAKQINFSQAPIEKATDYSAEDADMTWRLTKALADPLEKSGMAGLLEKVELPLAGALAVMERNGVLLDTDLLAELSVTLGAQIAEYEERVYESAGEQFNINSPKQLAHILFDKLGLTGGRKTKTGYSTDQNTLENLAHEHTLPALVVEYRQLAKLKNTYVDALPRMINPATGRVHTSFNQAVTATGRLSSSDPNLQNIPVRSELGRSIRRAFIAQQGCSIVSADYSQIELRLLAHYSKEKALLEAFANNEDIHARTAGEIFGVNPAFVTSDMRRVAKSVNFGIVYGQTAFGLARELGIPRNEAQRYINDYFKKYPGARQHIDNVIAEARQTGYTTTILGRKRYLPEITASNRQARLFAERNAVNSPLQGSAADLIKMAMISIQRRLNEEKFGARMILQVHDELVFETPDDETDRLMEMVKAEMENVLKLCVPLVVDIKRGANWDEAH